LETKKGRILERRDARMAVSSWLRERARVQNWLFWDAEIALRNSRRDQFVISPRGNA
jgi:hypothetical protein